MTKAEMTKIFSVLMLAYPNAEIFKAANRQELTGKLAPIIELWTKCLHDVDFRVGQMAVVEVCRSCKYPPSIAEMLEAAQAIQRKEAEAERMRRSLERTRRSLALKGAEPRALGASGGGPSG